MKTSPHVIPWYTQEQWEKVRAISADPDSMAASYEQWLGAAEKTAKRQQSAEVTVHRVFVEADKLLAFAQRSGRELTADTRVAYAIDHFIGAA